MDREQWKEDRTNRNLDWLSEWKEIAAALWNKTGEKWEANLQEAKPTSAPYIYLDGSVPLFAKPSPETSAGPEKAYVALRVPNDLRDHQPYDEDRPSIGLTFTKGPSRVAADIQRRLLDDAWDYHQECLERREQAKKDEARAEKQQARLEAETGQEVRDPHGGDPRIHLTSLLDDGYGRLFQSSPGSYRLDLGGLSFDTAVRIIQAIKNDFS